MKKLVVFSICCSLLLLCSGCGVINELKTVNPSASVPDSQVAAENLAETPISSAFINAGSQEYIVLHSSSDENSGAVARMYHGESIDIYELKGQWYRVKYGDLTGFVQADAVSFSQPEVNAQNAVIPAETTAAPSVSIISAENTPPVQTQVPAGKTEVKNTVNIVLQYDTDGIALPLSYRDVGYAEYNSGKTAYCSTTSCYIYKTASTSGPKREADMLYQGDPVVVYGDYDGFYYIGTDSGSGYELKGYVQMKYITIGTPPASDKKNYSATQGYVSVGSCNLRSSPSKADNSNVICTLKQGTTFTVNSFDGYWYYINCSSGSGYVSHKMVTVY